MKTCSHFFTTKFCLLFLFFPLFGCTFSPGSRFYTGDLLPRKDVAFIYMADKCQLGSITKEGREKMNFLMWSSCKGEIIPGDYILELRYFYSGTHTKLTGKTVNFPLQAEAGHIYYIQAEHPSPDAWRPSVIDIVDNEDYAKIANENPKSVKERVDKYFQGERIPLQESEFHKRGGGVIKAWH